MAHPARKISRPKISKFRRDLRQLRDLIANRPISGTQQDRLYRQTENGVANCGHSGTGLLIVVNFGLQTMKNMTRVSTHPTGGHHAGHCRACKVA